MASDSGNPNIFDAVKSGDVALVRDIVLAEPTCVKYRNSAYDIIPHAVFWICFQRLYPRLCSGDTFLCTNLLFKDMSVFVNF